MVNTELLNSLSSGIKQTELYAYLINVETNDKWEFLYNPVEEQFEQRSTFKEAPTALTKLPGQDYLYTSGRIRTFSNLLLQGFNSDKVIDSYIEKLENLLYANPKEGKFTPPELYFIWGAYRFGACYLSSIDGTYSLRLAGKPADGLLTITLIECPEKKPTVLTQVIQEPQTSITETIRQSTRGKLFKRIRNQIDTTINIARLENYKLVAQNEIVQIIGENGNLLGTADQNGNIIYN